MTGKRTQINQNGLLINRAGKNRYSDIASVGNVIRYITRENGKSKQDLICCGALGAIDYIDTDTIIRQFECVQSLHSRKGNFGRYIDHEIYSFSESEEAEIKQKLVLVDLLARKMASEFYRDGFQVCYGVHKSDQEIKHLHIHFAVNTVHFKTGRKRHENKSQTALHQERLSQIVADTIAQYAEK